MVSLGAKMRFNYRKNQHLIFLVLGVGFTLVFLWVILNRAWVGDDAYITFRVVDNFLHGFGLRWNIQERVQVFTHPLWFFLISLVSVLTKEVYLTSMYVGVFLSLLVCVLMLNIKKLSLANGIGVLILSFSGSFVDYSTSGLENALTHVLLISFAYIYLREEIQHRFLLLAFIMGLAGFNRLDVVLFLIPAMIQCYLDLERGQEKKRAIGAFILGSSPIWIWEVFSLIYYGFPFPNTFYAKLTNWLTVADLLKQGLLYLQHTALNDPVTGIVVILGLFTSFLHWQKKRAMLTFGTLFYLGYVVWIGGDFMEGRFLTGIFLMMVIELVCFEIDRIPIIHFGWILPLLLVFDFYGSVPTFVAYSWNFVEPWQDGIVNERAFYWPETGLFRDGIFNTEPGFPWVGEGRELASDAVEGTIVVQRESVGFVGYYAGPKVIIVDELGLGDALIARMPPRMKTYWRIGHFKRVIPEGYLAYKETGDLTKIQDLETRTYVEELSKVISEPLFFSDRYRTIYQLNIGYYANNLNQRQYSLPSLVLVDGSDVAERKVGLAWNDPEVILGYDSGIMVVFDQIQVPEVLEVSISLVENLEIQYFDAQGDLISSQRLRFPSSSRLRAYQFPIPQIVQETGFSTIHLLPLKEKVEKSSNFSIGHVIIIK